MTQPYDFRQAKEASAHASTVQRQAEQFVIDSGKRYAAAEKAYREALAKEILQLRAGGMAITACGDVARGESHVANLKFKRDVAEAVKEAASQAVWRAKDDRKDEGRFIDWSARRELAEGYGQVPVPDLDEPAVGARRAA